MCFRCPCQFPVPGQHGSMRKITWSEFIHNPILASKHWDNSFSPDTPRTVGLDMQLHLHVLWKLVSKYEMENLLENVWFCHGMVFLLSAPQT